MWDENKVRIVDVADALGLSTAINSLSDEIEKAGYFLMLKKAKDIMDTECLMISG